MQNLDLSGAASSRLEASFSRAYTSVVLVTFIEVMANAIAQSSNLNGWSWLALSLVAFSILGMSFWAWRFGNMASWPYLHGATGFLSMIMWPWLVVDPAVLASDFQPWPWWVIGMATISVGVTAPIWIGTTFLFVTSATWFFVDVSPYAGSSNPWISLQDAVYTFLIGGAVSGLIIMVKQAAKRTDKANSAVIRSAIEQAQIDAIERERQRIDALVHDRVLNTLVLASKAKGPEEQREVAKMSQEAISSLEQAAKEPRANSAVTFVGLFQAIRKTALRLDPRIQVDIFSTELTPIPSAVAQAVTEATLQALDNALRHSNANSIGLQMGANGASQLEIKVVDDGIGFKVEKMSRDRIGVRTSILARLKMVGADVSIQSSPGSGTAVTIRWSA